MLGLTRAAPRENGHIAPQIDACTCPCTFHPHLKKLHVATDPHRRWHINTRWMPAGTVRSAGAYHHAQQTLAMILMVANTQRRHRALPLRVRKRQIQQNALIILLSPAASVAEGAVNTGYAGRNPRRPTKPVSNEQQPRSSWRRADHL